MEFDHTLRDRFESCEQAYRGKTAKFDSFPTNNPAKSGKPRPPLAPLGYHEDLKSDEDDDANASVPTEDDNEQSDDVRKTNQDDVSGRETVEESKPAARLKNPPPLPPKEERTDVEHADQVGESQAIPKDSDEASTKETVIRPTPVIENPAVLGPEKPPEMAILADRKTTITGTTTARVRNYH